MQRVLSRLGDVAARLDGAAGSALEAATRRHHRRRLGRIGWSGAFDGDPVWAGVAPPPREGNRVDVHVDGGSALPAMVRAIRSAHSSVHIAGWAISPDFVMAHEPEATTVRALLASVAERAEVRVLIWAGAALPLFHPTRAQARHSLQALVTGTRIAAALDRRHRPLHCHHEKLVIVDGHCAFVGGIDLTHLAGNRYDNAPHPAGERLGWHDAAALVEGPAVHDVAAHFAMRWREITGERLSAASPPEAAGSTRVQVVRTVPEGTYRALPRGDFSILQAYVGALRSATSLIYLENQFLWSAEIVALLRRKLISPPSDDFRCVIVLPMRPNNGSADTQGQLAVLRDADRHQRLLVGTVGPVRPEDPPVYVHAKIGLVDDRWITLGSANLNEHSLFNDTEMNIVSDDPALARSVREKLWSEHLGEDCSGRDPVTVLEERWRPCVTPGSRPDTPLRCLPGGSPRLSRVWGPLNGLVVDG